MTTIMTSEKDGLCALMCSMFIFKSCFRNRMKLMLVLTVKKNRHTFFSPNQTLLIFRNSHNAISSFLGGCFLGSSLLFERFELSKQSTMLT